MCTRLWEALAQTEQILQHSSSGFDFHPTHGYITSNPLHLGLGLHLYAAVKLPHVARQGDFEDTCQLLRLRFQGSRHSGTLTLTNLDMFGLSEEEVVTRFVAGVQHLINLERNLDGTAEMDQESRRLALH